MKIVRLLVTTAALAMLSAVALAGPFASQISVESSTVAESLGTTISYVLNEAADSVTIEIKDSGDITVATFAGTANQGLNVVGWDGTVDNAGGADVPAGNGYYVQVTAEVTSNPGFHMYAENLSGGGGNGQVFANFSPNVAVFFNDNTNENFGTIILGSSWSGSGFASGIQFRADGLTLDLQDGTTNRGPIHPDEISASIVNGSIWGLTQDPDDENILWGASQGGVQWYYADVSSGIDGSNFTDADAITTPLGALFPRDAAILNHGADKYLYFTRSNGIVGRVKMLTTNFSSENADQEGQLLNLAGASQYAKDLTFDSAGNLYWTTKNGGPDGPRVYRWDNADVLAAPGVPLTEANATWVVDFPTTGVAAMGTAIGSDNHVYATVNLSTGSSGVGGVIYDLGLATQASVIGVAGETIGTELVSGLDNPDLNITYGNIHADAFGNLLTHDRASERIQLWSVGGNSTHVTRSTPANSFDIATPPLSVPDWMIH